MSNQRKRKSPRPVRCLSCGAWLNHKTTAGRIRYTCSGKCRKALGRDHPRPGGFSG